jgi:succinate dehydrogenase / fumarate reductase cytochrome b subunit
LFIPVNDIALIGFAAYSAASLESNGYPMASPAVKKKARPLSPHLQVYRPQLTSGLSIFHRMTGIGLAAGLPVFVLWLVVLAKDEKAYDQFLTCAHTIVGIILLMGWTWAFAYHLCMGVRHLLWDMGLFLEIKQVYTTGYIALLVSTLATLALWCKFLLVHV